MDYGFRFYDPAIARFTTIDPLAEDYSFQSPYAYGVNNPILYRDIMGLGVDWIDNEDGTYTAEAGDSAFTLARDADLTLEEADKIVQEQYGPNYEGDDGEMKSNIDPGNVVDVCCSEKTEVAQNVLNNVAQINIEKESKEKVHDSLSGKISEDHFDAETYKVLNKALDYERGLDPGTAGASGALELHQARNESDSVRNVKKRAKVRKSIDSLNQKLDSLTPPKKIKG